LHQPLLLTEAQVGTLIGLYPNAGPTQQLTIRDLLEGAPLSTPKQQQWAAAIAQVTSKPPEDPAALSAWVKEDALKLHAADIRALQRSLPLLLGKLGWSADFLFEHIQHTTAEHALRVVAALEKLADYSITPDMFNRHGRTALSILHTTPPADWVSALAALIGDDHFFVPKDVATLLAQMRKDNENKENNEDNAVLLARIDTGYFTGLLHKIEQIRHDALPLSDTISDLPRPLLPLSMWRAEEFQRWHDGFAKRAELGLPTVTEDNVAETIAILAEAMHQTVAERQFHIRSVQCLAALVLYLSPEGGLAQISTGEGKSIIVAMFAALSVLSGRKVDVITSASSLAMADAKKQKPFYDLLGMTSSHNINNAGGLGPKACYDAKIVYGSLIYFIGDALRDITSNTKLGRGFDLVIMDEVDNMFIDQTRMKVQLSNSIPGFDALRQVLLYMWATATTTASQLRQEGDQCYVRMPIPKETDEEAAEKDFLTMAKEHEEQEMQEVLLEDDCPTSLRKFMERYTTDHLFALHETPENRQVRIPTHLKQFVQDHLPKWLDSLLVSHQYEEKSHYIVHDANPGKAPGQSVTPLDYRNTGELQHGLKWADGLHQFLEINHSVTLHSETLISIFMSYVGYILQYKGSIYGLTGTLGSEAHRKFLKHQYGVSSVLIPTFTHKDLVEMPTIIASSQEEWKEDVLHAIARKVSPYRAGLVVFETIAGVENFSHLLEESGHDAADISLYGRGKPGEAERIEKAFRPNEVLMATNMAGRGTDVKLLPPVVKEGGLHTIATSFADNSRSAKQVAGRGARKDEPGSVQIMTYEGAVAHYECPVGDDDCLKDERDAREAEQLQDDQWCTLPALLLQDEVFKEYVALMKTTSSPTGYRLALPSSGETREGTLTLLQKGEGESSRLFLSIFAKDKTRHEIDITDAIETIDPKAAKHMRIVLADPKSTVASITQQEDEILHFIAAQHGFSQHPQIYKRVQASFAQSQAEDVPASWLEQYSMFGRMFAWSPFAVSESTYLTWLLGNHADFADLNLEAKSQEGITDALLAQVKERQLFRLWMADRALYNNEFELKQITEYWAIWLKQQADLFTAKDECYFHTREEQDDTTKQQKERRTKLMAAFEQFSKNITALDGDALMQNPSYLVNKAWRYREIHDEQKRAYAFAHRNDIKEDGWGFFTNIGDNIGDFLGLSWKGHAFNNFDVEKPMGQSLRFVDRSLELDEIYSWIGHNAMSILRLLKDGEGITEAKQATDANNVKEKFCKDTEKAIINIVNWVIPSLEGQLSFLFMHKLILPTDPLAIQLMGSVKVYEKIVQILHRNIDIAASGRGDQGIRLNKHLPLEELMAGFNVTEMIWQMANATDNTVAFDRMMRNHPEGISFTSQQLVFDEIITSGGVLFEIELYGLNKEAEDWFGTIFSAVLGVAQIFLGFAIMAMGGVFAGSFGMSLVLQGIGDVIGAAISVATGQPIDFQQYLNSKGMGIAIALATAGTMAFLDQFTVFHEMEFMKKLGKPLGTATKTAFFGTMTAFQVAGTVFSHALYGIGKSTVDSDEIRMKAQQKVQALLSEYHDMLQIIFASDAYGDHSLARDLEHRVERIIDEYARRFHNDATQFGTGYVGNMLSSFIGTPHLGSAFTAAGKATMGGIKNAEALDSIFSDIAQAIRDTYSKATTPAAMLRKKLTTSFGAPISEALMEEMQQQGYLPHDTIPYQSCGKLKDVTHTATTAGYNLVSACEAIAEILKKSYQSAFDRMHTAITNRLTGTIANIQKNEILRPITDAAGSAAGNAFVTGMQYLRTTQEKVQTTKAETVLEPELVRKKEDFAKGKEKSGLDGKKSPKPTQGEGTSYTVRDGDTVSEIAARHGITEHALLDLNPELRAKQTTSSDGKRIIIIHPEDEIRLPVGVTPVRQDTQHIPPQMQSSVLQTTNDIQQRFEGNSVVSKPKDPKGYWEGLKEILQDPLVNGIATGEAVASQLPGREQGLADAYRHLLWGAELIRRYPDIIAEVVLGGHEIGEKGAGTKLDSYNNQIAVQIGKYADAHGGSWEEVRSLCREAMEKSFSGYNPHQIENWAQHTIDGESFYTTSTEPIQLSNGLTVNRVAVLPPSEWLKNPESPDGNRLTTEEANWPKQGWVQRFVYEPANRAKLD
jgi:hypothetical protein